MDDEKNYFDCLNLEIHSGQKSPSAHNHNDHPIEMREQIYDTIREVDHHEVVVVDEEAMAENQSERSRNKREQGEDQFLMQETPVYQKMSMESEFRKLRANYRKWKNQKENNCEKNPQNSTKGLKNLSHQIVDIMKGFSDRKKGIPYKNAAEIIYQKLREHNQFLKSKNQDGKNHSNVKRRIYDAINVLKAVQIFQADNDCLIFNHQIHQRQRQRKQTIERVLKTANYQLNEKTKKYDFLIDYSAKLKALASQYRLQEQMEQENRRSRELAALQIPKDCQMLFIKADDLQADEVRVTGDDFSGYLVQIDKDYKMCEFYTESEIVLKFVELHIQQKNNRQ